MNNKPKRKPKIKNISIDEQIESFLDDDEYIIWSERTQSHYFEYTLRLIRDLTIKFAAFLAVVGGALLLLNIRTFAHVLPMVLCILGITGLMGAGYLYLSNNNVRQILDYVNVITNYQVMVYDPIMQEIVFSFEHDHIHHFRVREYGEDIGTIIVDRRSDSKVKYRTSSRYPLEFALHGIDELGKVVNLLRSQVGIEPEYLQLHQKSK